MKTLLRIDSSLRFNESVSRNMGDHFEDEWKKVNPTGKTIYRDVGKDFIPHLDQHTLNGYFDNTVQSQLLQKSDRFIDELHKCSELLITVPVYNFGIPSSLKAWIDLVLRTEKTFRYEEESIVGMLQNKTAYVVTTMGGQKKDGLSLVERHLKEALNFIGISSMHFFAIDGTAETVYTEQIMAIQKKQITKTLKSLEHETDKNCY